MPTQDNTTSYETPPAPIDIEIDDGVIIVEDPIEEDTE